ncbi:hypothetical protein [Legionella jordanis]|uniref:Uncharacterized protein n=1 Tax=Legionella jordanis TaxID=456 RepID=A0A0W0VCN3_9GAMM|nr:hypothetical protein [Legionella jordanis]KTD17848.1 hypothetical protein Ljor_2154 [Legionella jordanis]RMX02452.1 hypothetical protein EAW55_09395 [Legionella jordanis]RMX21705.1 hypothetical protein EAS68_02825 [Legionella jordanis]VEH11215.1 Uncharacterised protein [Legionella jordanis]HAT8713817.1 hypothetical protein [Legionella jordanis]
MRYAVTYCVEDGKVGSNPFWHSCLLLSQWTEGQKMEVVEQWGFYGVSTNSSSSAISRLKKKLGLNLDFQGNHGMLMREDIRFLDLGYGLHGVTFELTEVQFVLLRNNCEKMAEEQKKAIEEAMHPVQLPEQKKYRVYPFETFSREIFGIEKAKAKLSGQEPRLKPFELKCSWGLFGPDFNQSFTCKTQAISLLKTVLSESQIKRLTVGDSHKAIPRLSGPMEEILLHSRGPLRLHHKKSGEQVHYRDARDKEVKLFWSIPPQEMECLSASTDDLLKIPKEYYAEVKSLVSKLQQLEWLFINAKLPAKYESYRTGLIKEIRQCYDCFAEIKPKQAKERISGWQGYFFSLLSLPRDKDEDILQNKIRQGKMLLNSIYMAIVDNWSIDDELPPETIVENSNHSDGEVEGCNPLAALSAYLMLKDKIKICNCLGRSYLANGEEQEKSAAAGLNEVLC